MVKSLSTLAGIAAVAFAASAGIATAECFDAHQQTTASVSQPQEGAAMSTFDGQQPAQAEETAEEAKVSEAPSTDGEAGADRDKN